MNWTRSCDWLIEVGVVGLFLFAPLPFGSVVPWAQAVIEGTVAFLLAVWVVRMVLDGEVRLRRVPLLWPAVAMALLITVQLLLPFGGSINGYATWSGLRLYLAYLGLGLLLVHHAVTKARLVRLLSIVIGWGALLAVLGLANQLERGVLPWFLRPPSLDRLTSTFVNPNHQALYFSILFFLALGLLLRLPRRSRSGRPQSEALEDRMVAGRVLLAGAIALIGGALVLTLSRGGLFGAMVGLLLVLGIGLHGRVGTRTLCVLGGVVALVLAFATWFGVYPLLERFSAVARDPFTDLRWAVWERTLWVIGDAPFLGVGLGAFQDAFQLYRPEVIPSGKVVEHAHNDYLQLLAETGVAGLLIGLWGLAALYRFVLRRWTVRQDPFVRGLTLGAIGALGATAAHSAIDYGLHMPANALLLVLVVALLPVIVTLRPQAAGDEVDLREWVWEVGPRARIIGVAAAGVGLCLVGWTEVSAALSGWYYERATGTAGEIARFEGEVSMAGLVGAYGDLELAARWDRRNPVVQHAFAGVAEELAWRVWNHGVAPDGRRLTASPEERFRVSQPFFAAAYSAYGRSLQRRPRAAQTHERMGWFLAGLETVRRTVKEVPSLYGAVDPRLTPALDAPESLHVQALVHLREAVAWDPQNAHRHHSLALFALAHLIREETGRQVVTKEFHQALTLEPALLREVIHEISALSSAPGLLEASIPRRYNLWLAAARHLHGQGRSTAANAAFEEALALAPSPGAQVEVRLAYSQALLKIGGAPGALVQARHALVLAPKYPRVFLALGEAYEALGKWEEAQMSLASAVALARAEEPAKVNEYRARFASYVGRRGQGARALSFWRQVLQDLPNDAWAHLEVGRLLEQGKELGEAFQEYRAAEGLGLNDWRLQREVGRAYVRSGLYREAAIAYERAVRLHPSENEVRMEMANLYLRMGRGEQAAEQFRWVLTRQPDHGPARRSLAGATGTAVTTPGR